LSYTPYQAVILSESQNLAAQVQSNGKPHADAILVGTLEQSIVLEPVDFKWTLETANVKQVGIAVLEALLDEPPSLLKTALDAAIAQTPHPVDGEPRLHDGIFLAPDSAANRAHLAPRGPLDPGWAALVPVDWNEFFPPLVGWDVAQLLAQIDRTRISGLESAERYYRLGAGVRGGLRKLAAGIFAAEPAAFDDIQAVESLQRERKLRGVGEIVAHLDGVLSARSELVQKLREAERAAYPFGRFMADLKALGIDTKSEDRRWRGMYGRIMKQLGGDIRAFGQERTNAGASQQDALTAIAEHHVTWLSLAREVLRQEIASTGE
jgi:hypothetical protein